MPSRRHDLLARAIPRIRKSRELDDEHTERLRVERGQGGQGDRGSAWAAGSEVGGEDTGTSPERTLNKS